MNRQQKAVPDSLRERKKYRMRQELARVARRLFMKQGFDATTLEQICAEVEVHPQTALRYFGSKVDLALHFEFERLAHISELVVAAPRPFDPHRFMLGLVEGYLKAGKKDQIEQYEIDQNYRAFIDNEPALRQAFRDLQQRYVQCLTEAALSNQATTIERELYMAAYVAGMMTQYFTCLDFLMQRKEIKRALPSAMAVLCSFPNFFPSEKQYVALIAPDVD